MPRGSPPSPAAPADADDLAALKALAEAGAARGFVQASSGDLAARLGVSQQTASRRLLALESRGLVERRTVARHPQLRLTGDGVAALRRELEHLRGILEPQARALALRGRVATGMGEGGWYIARRGYRDAMKALLGFEPFPGTLNVALEGAEAAKLTELSAQPGLVVAEFVDEGRSFGAVKCFRASLGGVDAAVVMPARGHYRDVAEVVAPFHLRDKLGLRDGDAVTVEVTLG